MSAGWLVDTNCGPVCGALHPTRLCWHKITEAAQKRSRTAVENTDDYLHVQSHSRRQRSYQQVHAASDLAAAGHEATLKANQAAS